MHSVATTEPQARPTRYPDDLWKLEAPREPVSPWASSFLAADFKAKGGNLNLGAASGLAMALAVDRARYTQAPEDIEMAEHAMRIMGAKTYDEAIASALYMAAGSLMRNDEPYAPGELCAWDMLDAIMLTGAHEAPLTIGLERLRAQRELCKRADQAALLTREIESSPSYKPKAKKSKRRTDG